MAKVAREAGARRTAARVRGGFWSQTIERFPLPDRLLHWSMAIGGVIAMLTGLGWFARSYDIFLTLFGGGATARLVHVITGTVFTIATVVLFAGVWGRRLLRFRPEDREWLRTMGGYLDTHGGEADHAEPAGFFNAGQKILGYTYLVLAVLLVVTGVVIWFPETFGPVLVRLALPLHVLGFIAFAAGLVMHVYLASVANPGTFGSMVSGRVSRLWAKQHHPLWYEQVERSQGEAASRAGTEAN